MFNNSAKDNQRYSISEYPSLNLPQFDEKSLFEISIDLNRAIEEELVEKANLYNIKYTVTKDGIRTLRQNIDEYEFLLDTARELGIVWDLSDYDIIGLMNEIEERQTRAKIESKQLRQFYFSAIEV